MKPRSMSKWASVVLLRCCFLAGLMWFASLFRCNVVALYVGNEPRRHIRLESCSGTLRLIHYTIPPGKGLEHLFGQLYHESETLSSDLFRNVDFEQEFLDPETGFSFIGFTFRRGEVLSRWAPLWMDAPSRCEVDWALFVPYYAIVLLIGALPAFQVIVGQHVGTTRLLSLPDSPTRGVLWSRTRMLVSPLGAVL